MKIGIDASKTTKKEKTGIDYTAYQIILNLKKIDHTNSYSLYTQEPVDRLLKGNNFVEKLIPFPKFWNKFRLPLALLKDRPEKFLELTSSIPPLAPQKTAVFIHDLAFKFFPEAYSPYEQFLQESAIKMAINKANKIIFSSKANANDFLSFYSFPKENISIIPLAYNSDVYKKIEKPKTKLKINKPFFLFVGRLESRKNVERIIEAFEIFKERNKSDHILILVGKEGYEYKKIAEKINSSEQKQSIKITGYLKDEEIANLYSMTEGFIFPSLYEGFGIPILEAFSCGAPVITSNIKTIKTIGEDAVLYVNPEKTDEITDAMEKIVKEKKLRKNMIESGKNIAKKYTWEKTANLIHKLIIEM